MPVLGSKTVASRWRVQIEWSESQNIPENYSTVTAKLYWISLDQYGAITASARNAVSLTINGDTKTGTATSALNAYQKKLMLSHSVRVNHNSDGTKSISISGAYNVNAQLSGTWYYNQTVSGTARLTDIPRGSYFSSDGNWTAGSNKSISITRYSSSFSHVVRLYIKNTSGNWVLIKTLNYNANTTSQSTNFSFAENQLIFNTMAQRTSAESRMELDTYSGSTKIDSGFKTGTIGTPQASFPASPSGFTIGSSFRAEAKYYLKAFSHTIRLKNGGTVLKSYTGISSENTSGTDAHVEFFTNDIKNALLNLTPNSKSVDLTLEVITYYGNAQVRSPRTKTITANVVGSAPTFSLTIPYRDTNSITTTITGNDQFIVSEKSSLEVRIPVANRAIANDGASMIRYVASVGGKTLIRNYSSNSDVVFNFGELSPKVDQTLVIRADDSRGNTATQTRIIKIIPYSKPTISVSAQRLNSFEELTKVNVTGMVSPLTINGENKNNIHSIMNRRKPVGSSAWSGWGTLLYSGFPAYQTQEKEYMLDRMIDYHIEVQVTDRLGTTSVVRVISSGKPIMHIDEQLKSIGFGDFPDSSNQILLNMMVKFGGNNFASTGAALDMNNSDIIGGNGFYFNDIAGASGEGFNFLKSGAPEKSLDAEDYDNFYILNGGLYLNGRLIMKGFTGDNTGDGITLGAGGRTVVGGGEAAETLMAFLNSHENEQLHLASDNNVYVETGLQNGVGTRHTWRFDENGILYKPRYKEGNGFNSLTGRVSPNSDSPLLIQNIRVAISVSAATGYVDVTFPTSFDATAQWVLATAVDSNASSTHVSVYNVTGTGCRIYASHILDYQASYTAYAQVLACGIKA